MKTCYEKIVHGPYHETYCMRDKGHEGPHSIYRDKPKTDSFERCPHGYENKGNCPSCRSM